MILGDININNAYISSVDDGFIDGIASIIGESKINKVNIGKVSINTFGHGNFISGISPFAINSRIKDTLIKTVLPYPSEARENDNILSSYIYKNTSSLDKVEVQPYKSRHKSNSNDSEFQPIVYKYVPYQKKENNNNNENEYELKNGDENENEEYYGTSKFQKWVNGSPGKNKILYGMEKFRDN